MMISTYGFETFWSPLPRGKFSLSDEADKLKRYNSSRICVICLVASDMPAARYAATCAA